MSEDMGETKSGEVEASESNDEEKKAEKERREVRERELREKIEREEKERIEKKKMEKKREAEGERNKRNEEHKRSTRLSDPPLPFPYKAVEKQLEDKFLKFLEHMRQLEMKIPFLEAMEQMPQYAKHLKTLLNNKKKLEEIVSLPHQVSAIIQGTLPKKEKARGPFVLPVSIGNLAPRGALADLGASICLIPLSIARQLPFKLKPSRKTIQLADRSIKVPCGEIEDLPIQVGSVVVPCDFVVLDMVEDPVTPLILSRDALKTLGAVINCADETIIVKVAQEEIVFAFSQSLKEPMVEQLCSLSVLNNEERGRDGRLKRKSRKRRKRGTKERKRECVKEKMTRAWLWGADVIDPSLSTSVFDTTAEWRGSRPPCWW